MRVLCLAKRSNQLIWKEINPSGLIRRTDAEAEATTLLSLDVKCRVIEKDWCWERLKAGGEGATEDEMVGWHH